MKIATNIPVDLDELLEFVRPRHHAILLTFRADGMPQGSPVTSGVDDSGRIVISTYPDRAKTVNVRRDSRAAVIVLSDEFNSAWVQVDGVAEVIDAPDSVEPLVEYYRNVAGEHPDWDEYRQAMIRQDKSLIRVTPQRWGRWPPAAFRPVWRRGSNPSERPWTGDERRGRCGQHERNPHLRQAESAQHPTAGRAGRRRRRPHGRDRQASFSGARDPSQPNLRQVHLIHSELHDELRAAGFNVAAGELGENITTRGLDVLGLPAGTRLHVGDSAIVEVTGLRNPCFQIDDFQQGVLKAVLGSDDDGHVVRKAGIMGVVVSGGEVRPDDPIEVELPAGPRRALQPV